MLIVVRHGTTEMNETSKGERLRGWLPVPLDLNGMKQAREVAEDFDGVEGVNAIYCSDLARTVQTAHEIGQVLSEPIIPCEELRDWDYGKYAGVEVSDKVIKALHNLMEDPNKKAPEGESFQTFLDRTVPFLHKCVKDDHVQIAVTHNRVCTLIAALSKNHGTFPDMKTLKGKGPIDPAGIMIIKPDWSIAFKTSLDKEKD